jgi:ribosomal protein L30/L7E
MSVHSTKRQPQRKGGGAKRGKSHRFKEGELVEVELRRSRSEASRSQRDTLDSLGLGRLGQSNVVRFRKSTDGMFSLVSHLITVRPARGAKAASARARRKRKSARSRRRASGSAAVTELTYKSGGGESRLLEVPGAGLLRVEAQRESYALMWPSHMTLAAFVGAARKLGWSEDGSASLMSFEASEVTEFPVTELPARLEEKKAWRFVRIDFTDRALTWASQYKDPERSGFKVAPEIQLAHEASLSGLHFDVDYAAALLTETAPEPMVKLVPELMKTAKETLSAYL